jgi:hypothetical protein
MFKIFVKFIMLGSIFFFLQCMSMNSRIIQKTDDTAIIQGVAATKIEAKINAENEAKKIFINYEETKECECTQEASGRTSSSGKYRSSTYWSCIIYVKKK